MRLHLALLLFLHKVTKSDKNIVYELDGKSIYDTYKYYLGDNAATKLPAIGIEFPLIIEKNGVRVARAVLSKNDDNSLVFAGNVKEGEKVQLGYGNVAEILRSTSKNIILDSQNVESVFVYSCMARRRFLQDNAYLEVEMFVEHGLPVSGFFTYGEFFKGKKSCELLNQTMTTIGLSEQGTCNLDPIKEDHISERIVKNDSQNDTMLALSNLVNVTSKELEKSNLLLQENVDKKTAELSEKVIELEKATRAKSDFLANMSHEIRTPLNAINGFIDILSEKEKNDESLKYLNVVKESGKSLMVIINDILDFSKIESGNFEIESIEFDLKKLIREIGLLFFEKAKEKNINMKVNFYKDVQNNII